VGLGFLAFCEDIFTIKKKHPRDVPEVLVLTLNLG
jgi:hypothetical protein